MFSVCGRASQGTPAYAEQKEGVVTMTTEAQAMTAYLEARLPAYLDDLRQLCSIECPTSSKAGVDDAGAWVRRWLASRGWEVRQWPDATAGDSLATTLRG